MFKAIVRVGAFFQHQPRWRIAMAWTLCGILLVNWLAPVGLRLKWSDLNSMVLFASILLLCSWAYFAAGQLASRWPRVLARSLSVSVITLVIPAGCVSLIFRLDVDPVAVISVGSEQVVASWVTGSAVGPHYTEFRQERSVLPGIKLVRLLGSSGRQGNVTMSFTPPHTLRAEVSDDPPGSLDVIEMRVSPLVGW